MKRFVLLFLWVGFGAVAQETKPVNHSKDGISVDTYNFNGLEKFLHQKNDTIYVVNFWATWCVPCVKELPFYEKLQSEYKSKKVKVLLISLDMNKDVETRLIPFIKKKNLQSQVLHLHDPNADVWIPKVDPDWSGAIPATIIYSGETRKFYERSFTYEELENEVKPFIK